MADNTPAAPAAQAPKTNEPAPAVIAPAPSEPKSVRVGGKVTVVTAKNERLPAKVTNVLDDGLIDLEFQYGGSKTVITRSPYDPKAMQADSWH